MIPVYFRPGYSPNWIFCSTNLLCWSYQIANGMEYLGTKDVVHGDLFIKNVLIASNGVAKITDFGLARQFGFDGKRYIRAHDVRNQGEDASLVKVDT